MIVTKTYSSPPCSLSRRKPPPIPTKIREKDKKAALKISGFIVLMSNWTIALNKDNIIWGNQLHKC
jgi:hypothetical protein